MSTIILAHLVALRAHLDATIALVEATVRPIPEDEDAAPQSPGCRHPPDRQRDASTFGMPGQIVCLDCGFKRAGTPSP